MRTNIVIDDSIMKKAQGMGGFKTKKDTIEQALIFFIQMKGQQMMKKLKGKINWQGNLDEMRRD
jgi:Arc/MetJ family transcription regulator